IGGVCVGDSSVGEQPVLIVVGPRLGRVRRALLQAVPICVIVVGRDDGVVTTHRLQAAGRIVAVRPERGYSEERLVLPLDAANDIAGVSETHHRRSAARGIVALNVARGVVPPRVGAITHGGAGQGAVLRVARQGHAAGGG